MRKVKKLSVRIASALLIGVLCFNMLSPVSFAASTVSGEEVVQYARQWVGVTPYLWGGTSLTTGADCSGFICRIYEHFGIDLWQYRRYFAGMPSSVATDIGTDLSQAQLGDIVVCNNGSHAAIYSGQGKTISARSTSSGTKEDSWTGVITHIMRLKQLDSSGSSGGSVSGYMTISGNNTPGSLTVGDSFSGTGIVNANVTINWIWAGILDAAGNHISEATANPGTYSYDISGLVSQLSFSTLSAGTYRYAVEATGSDGNYYCLIGDSFTVAEPVQEPAQSYISISNNNTPGTLTVGDSFRGTGIVTSNYEIDWVWVAVLDAAGTHFTEASANPWVCSVDLSSLASKLNFSKLTAGTYLYIVKATNSRGSYCTLVEESFTVTAPTIHFSKPYSYVQGQFSDVPGSRWFTDSVADVYAYGLMRGTSQTKFDPNGDVTMAQAIAIASRIHSIYTTGSENFTPSAVWYQTYLDYAYKNGIISAATYRSDVKQKATRLQVAEILANAMPAAGLAAINRVSDNAIPDVKMSDSGSSSVYKLYRAGIISGMNTSGTFSPGSYITRAQCAAIISRMADSDSRIAFTLTR